MVQVFDRGQLWRHMEWTFKGGEREDVREDFLEMVMSGLSFEGG